MRGLTYRIVPKAQAGSYMQAASSVIDMAMPLIENAGNKKREKKMNEAYTSAGALDNNRWEKFSDKNTKQIDAVSSKAYNNLISVYNNGGGVMYRKSQQGSEVSPGFGGQMKPATEKAVKDEASKGYGVSNTYNTNDNTVRTIEMSKPGETQKPIVGWNYNEDDDTPLSSIDPTPKTTVKDGHLRTHRRGIFRNIGPNRMRKVNIIDKMLNPSRYTSTSAQADKKGYK